jgi:hypothetical protein
MNTYPPSDEDGEIRHVSPINGADERTGSFLSIELAFNLNWWLRRN